MRAGEHFCVECGTGKPIKGQVIAAWPLRLGKPANALVMAQSLTWHCDQHVPNRNFGRFLFDDGDEYDPNALYDHFTGTRFYHPKAAAT